MALHYVLLRPTSSMWTWWLKVSKYTFGVEVTAAIKTAADWASVRLHQLRATLGVQRMHADGLSELSGRYAADGHGQSLEKVMMCTSSLSLPGHSTRLMTAISTRAHCAGCARPHTVRGRQHRSPAPMRSYGEWPAGR